VSVERTARDGLALEDELRCRCTNEAGDSDCSTHPRCNNCGEDLGDTELKADRDLLLAKYFALHAEIVEQERDLAATARALAEAEFKIERMLPIVQAAATADSSDTFGSIKVYRDEAPRLFSEAGLCGSAAWLQTLAQLCLAPATTKQGADDAGL
jgi:hypothetical protein